MNAKKIAAALLCIAMLLAMAGCAKISEYEFSFDENAVGKVVITTYKTEESIQEMLTWDLEEVPEEPIAIDYEKEGLFPAVIGEENFVGSTKEYNFRSAKELDSALAKPIADDENDPLADFKNSLGEDIDKISYSMFNKDGYRYFRLVFNGEDATNAEELVETGEMDEAADASNIAYNPETDDPAEVLESIEMIRVMLGGDSTKITLRAVMGVEVEGDCSTADISKSHATMDYYQELNAWLDRVEAAVNAGEAFEEMPPTGFVMTANLGGITKLPFTDVADNTWYKDPVFDAYAKGLIEGTSYDRFAPESSLTHAQALTLACRLRTLWENDGTELTDGDVIWYQPYLDYAKEKGITDNRFDNKMNEPVTRGEMAFYFSRALPVEIYRTDVQNELTDVAGNEYYENINRLAQSGIVEGYSDKTYLPGKLVRRSEAAKILAGMIEML